MKIRRFEGDGADNSKVPFRLVVFALTIGMMESARETCCGRFGLALWLAADQMRQTCSVVWDLWLAAADLAWIYGLLRIRCGRLAPSSGIYGWLRQIWRLVPFRVWVSFAEAFARTCKTCAQIQFASKQVAGEEVRMAMRLSAFHFVFLLIGDLTCARKFAL